MSPTRKNKIDLADYDYRRDIENRLLMATFSVTDVEVMEEILHSSLVVSIDRLASDLDLPRETLELVLEKLEKTGLFQRQGNELHIDKEQRKYYEFQILKFDDDFEPNMEFLQGLLRKVPIHVLPVWYSIPRSSTNIFESLVERFLATPRTFQRHLLELQLDDPILNSLVKRVYSAPNQKVRSRDLREEFNLTRDQFEECMLLLEFHFVCCLSYNRFGDEWKEVVTPFHEWRRFLQFRHDTMPRALQESEGIHVIREGAFVATRDMVAILQSTPISSKRPESEEIVQLAAKCGEKIEIDTRRFKEFRNYLHYLIEKLILLDFLQERDDALIITSSGEAWSELEAEERALALYRHPQNCIVEQEIEASLQTERNLREIERTLERVAEIGWIAMEDFLRGVLAPIGEAAEVSLQKKGRRWRYVLPTYSQEEKELIRATILERFFEAGLVERGELQGEAVFRVTPFGRSMVTGGTNTSGDRSW